MTFPTTSHLPLSLERRERFYEGARTTFENYCIARDILPPSAPSPQGDFRKLGLNNITDRIWFVDGNFQAGYATPSGAPYGIAVAEAEAELVLRRIVDLAVPDHIQEIPGDPEEADLDRAFVEMLNRGFHPNAILTNIYQSFRFWEFRQFRPSGVQRRGLRSPEGYFREVPVYHSRLLRNGVTFVVDKEQLGNLEVKTDFTVSVSDITDERERRAIRERFPGVEPAEKVRILCYEVVKPILRREDHFTSFIIVRSRGSGLEIGPP